MKDQRLTGASEHEVNTAEPRTAIEAKETTGPSVSARDVETTLEGTRSQPAPSHGRAAEPEPIQAAEKDRHAKKPYLSEQIFFMFSNTLDALNWPEKIGEIAMDEVCPGCVAALKVSNGQKCKEARFVGDDALYCFGFCEQAIN